MNAPYRRMSYGPLAYILILLAMVVGFFLTYSVVSPLVDLATSTVGSLVGDVLKTFGF